jgi:F-type H+-transporting ATPase subunit b
VRRLPLAALLLCYALPAFASAEKEAATTFLGLPVWLWKTANLLLFAALLVYLLAKPMARFFHTRREEIVRSLADAARQREEAARMKVEMERRVADLQGEIAALRERLRSDGERERGELERQGEAEAARMLGQLDEEARRRVADARTQLAGEAAQIAADLALELLERELTPADRDRIFKRTLERLSAPQSGGAR